MRVNDDDEQERERESDNDDDAWLHVCMCVRVSALSTVLPTQQRLTKCSQRTATSIKHAICFKIKCCSRLHTQWEFFVWLRSRAGPPVAFAITLTLTGRGSTQAHTRIESKRESETLEPRHKAHKQTARRRSQRHVCMVCVCVFVCNHACVYGCVRVFVVCLNFLALSLALAL